MMRLFHLVEGFETIEGVALPVVVLHSCCCRKNGPASIEGDIVSVRGGDSPGETRPSQKGRRRMSRKVCVFCSLHRENSARHQLTFEAASRCNRHRPHPDDLKT